jgi:hypothetical protein
LYGKSIYEKRVLVVIVTILLSVAAVGTFFAFEQLGAANSSTLTGDLGIKNTVQQAYGWNGTVWEKGSLTLTSTNQISVAFTNFAPKKVVIFEGNATGDVKNLVKSAYYYNTLNVETAGTANLSHAALTGAYMVFGTQVNDTSMNSVNDKGVSDVFLNNTVYTNTTSNMNKSYDMGLVALAGGNLNDKATIILTTNATLKVGATSTYKFTVTQEFQQPFNLDLWNDAAIVFSILGLVALFFVFLGMPRIGRR